MAEYLSYKEYTGMGGAMDAPTYARLSAAADAIINRMTHGRVMDEYPVREAVKWAAYALSEAMLRDEQSGADGREVRQITNDGVSIAFGYSETGSPEARAARRYAAIVRRYLEWEQTDEGAMLLYAGVDA